MKLIERLRLAIFPLVAVASNLHNTFAAPAAIAPAPFIGATWSGHTLTVALPAKSVVILELN
jgi:alpha-N-arabinofuranosidase